MPRRKLSKIDDLPKADLPSLSDQQMEWVRHRLAGKTASDAYRQSYDCSNMADRTVWAEASRINTDPDVAAWLAAAREACLGTASVTLASHVQELERLKEIALKTGNVGAAVAAEQSRGKASGLYVERFENVTPRDPMEILEELAASSPAVAEAMAAELGVELPVSRTEH